MLVNPHGGAVDKMNHPIEIVVFVGLLLKRIENTLPCAVFCPLVVAVIDGLPGAKLRR